MWNPCSGSVEQHACRLRHLSSRIPSTDFVLPIGRLTEAHGWGRSDAYPHIRVSGHNWFYGYKHSGATTMIAVSRARLWTPKMSLATLQSTTQALLKLQPSTISYRVLSVHYLSSCLPFIRWIVRSLICKPYLLLVLINTLPIITTRIMCILQAGQLPLHFLVGV